jgi:hypothetical protein
VHDVYLYVNVFAVVLPGVLAVLYGSRHNISRCVPPLFLRLKWVTQRQPRDGREAGESEPRTNQHHLPLNRTPDLLKYANELKKRGRKETTITDNIKRFQRLAKLCNDFNNPEDVREALATIKWSNSTKRTTVASYTAYLRTIGKEWIPPRCACARAQGNERVSASPRDSHLSREYPCSSATRAAAFDFLTDRVASSDKALTRSKVYDFRLDFLFRYFQQRNRRPCQERWNGVGCASWVDE